MELKRHRFDEYRKGFAEDRTEEERDRADEKGHAEGLNRRATSGHRVALRMRRLDERCVAREKECEEMLRSEAEKFRVGTGR